MKCNNKKDKLLDKESHKKEQTIILLTKVLLRWIKIMGLIKFNLENTIIGSKIKEAWATQEFWRATTVFQINHQNPINNNNNNNIWIHKVCNNNSNINNPLNNNMYSLSSIKLVTRGISDTTITTTINILHQIIRVLTILLGMDIVMAIELINLQEENPL